MEARYQIPANQKIVSVPVTLADGQACKITGNGSWLSHPHGSEGWCGIEGNGVTASYSHVIPGAPEGCLIVYRDGQNVAHFDGSNVATGIVITGPGTVGFGCNDDNFTDNQGSITVILDF